MQIGFFGVVGEIIGREITYAPTDNVATVGQLRASLAEAYPAGATWLLSPRLKVFVADAQAGDEASLEGVTRVEFLPPVSGG